ncbi:hypothetical protein Tdes44962_MAKER02394 [Teratosphaeria destructans]|uniref:Uncharacterized protein n=1 Tax=Teratosphaeria destructans TaxID=418781 RepID=A0A9W7STT0_9PEZI|nr:hypothetical protein Tdes44962_MAKER02394 [Teratosphaeria destructans]
MATSRCRTGLMILFEKIGNAALAIDPTYKGSSQTVVQEAGSADTHDITTLQERNDTARREVESACYL